MKRNAGGMTPITWQYVSMRYTDRLADNGIAPSTTVRIMVPLSGPV